MASTQTAVQAGGNHFTNVLDEVESAPAGQKADKLIGGIASQMQQSGQPQLQQWGAELRQIQAQLVQACKQQQGG